MKLLHFQTPSTPASTPPARERNRVFDAPDSAANAAPVRISRFRRSGLSSGVVVQRIIGCLPGWCSWQFLLVLYLPVG